MPLLHDGAISSIDDLNAYESDLQELANADNLDIDAKIRLAQVEIEAQLSASGQRPGQVYLPDDANGQGNGSDFGGARFDASHVVVTPPLKMWHIFQALSLFYRDANSRRASDRAAAKWIEYKELAKWSSELLFQTGVGLVYQPIPRPKAITLSVAPSALDSLSLFVRVTCVSGEAESAASALRATSTPAGQSLVVGLDEAPKVATGWNVYVGDKPSGLRLQNETPLELSENWTMPESGQSLGHTLGDGQSPDIYRTVPRFLWRG